MSGYIYRPPPPPPPPSALPPQSSIAGSNRGGYSAQHGNFQGNQGDRRGGRGGGRGGSLGGGRGWGGGGRGRGGSNFQQMGQRGGYLQQNQQFNPQRQAHPLSQLPPHVYTNPAFLNQQQQFFTSSPIYAVPTYSLTALQQQQQWQPPIPQTPPPENNPYLSYSQEQYQSQQLKQPPPLQTESYVSTPSGWPTQSSYGHFEPPHQPQPTPTPPQKQRRGGKPDMDEEAWLNLNGGKLLGTNIAPPETPEEIEAWITQRKARFPTAKKIAEAQEKEESTDKAREPRTAPQQVPSIKKRKRPTTDEGDAPPVGSGSSADSASDSEAPVAVSSKTKLALPDAPATGHHHESKKKLALLCRNYAARGKCPRGDTCNFRHEERKGQLKKKERKVDDGGRKTLYQRLVEHDREKENALMLQVIQYLIDKGRLQEESAQRGQS